VPCATDSRNNRSESRRNAFLESVESVRGRKRMIWKKLPSLWAYIYQCSVRNNPRSTHFAVLVSAPHMRLGPILEEVICRKFVVSVASKLKVRC
jgi:hypothetical protein